MISSPSFLTKIFKAKTNSKTWLNAQPSLPFSSVFSLSQLPKCKWLKVNIVGRKVTNGMDLVTILTNAASIASTGLELNMEYQNRRRRITGVMSFGGRRKLWGIWAAELDCQELDFANGTTSSENNSNPSDSSLESSTEDPDSKSTDHEEIAPPIPNHPIFQVAKNNNDSNLANQTNTPSVKSDFSLKFHPISTNHKIPQLNPHLLVISLVRAPTKILPLMSKNLRNHIYPRPRLLLRFKSKERLKSMPNQQQQAQGNPTKSLEKNHHKTHITKQQPLAKKTTDEEDDSTRSQAKKKHEPSSSMLKTREIIQGEETDSEEEDDDPSDSENDYESLKKDSSSSKDSDDIDEDLLDDLAPSIDNEVNQAFGEIINNSNLSPRENGRFNN
ncbi:hypothetical protein HAX54_038658 [Datura stramonium]|uniref:Uncharacterized protein n=1 Tax=Datura stramonium TaxID=4076 RepID=A0ABS8SIA5_DATST|nr:hypothetical protein [Datura stramonium]